jgi:hypothetical protein
MWPFERVDIDGVNFDLAGRQCEFLSGSCEVIGTLSVDVNCRPLRRCLSNDPGESLQARRHSYGVWQWIGSGMLRDLPGCVISITGLSEREPAEVGLWQELENAYEASGVSDAGQQNT